MITIHVGEWNGRIHYWLLIDGARFYVDNHFIAMVEAANRAVFVAN